MMQMISIRFNDKRMIKQMNDDQHYDIDWWHRWKL